MGRRGRGMGGGGRSGGFSGGNRGGGFRPGLGGNRGRSGRGGNSGGFGNVGGFGSSGNRRHTRGFGGLGSMLPWFLLGRMGGGGRRRPGGGGGGGCGGFGCLLPLILMVVFGFLFSNNTNNNTTFQNEAQTEVRDSTVERQPIQEGLVNETNYYTDQANWIVNENELLEGLHHFYELTNIQPHVYITDNINGETNPDINAVQSFTDELYEELFTDEAHVLLVFFENDDYSQQVSYHTAVGTDAQQVFDEEAQNILFDYLDYYYFSDFSEEQYFSTSFEETANDIMNTSSGLFSSNGDSSEGGLLQNINWSSIGIGVVGFIFILGIIIFMMNRRQKSQEAEIIGKDDDMSF